MELDLNEFGKRYVTYTTYVFNSILILGIVFIILVFTASGETLGNVFFATQFIYGTTLLFIPIGIILAIIKRTRKVGGAILYTIASVTLAYWWIAALLLLFDKGGIWWSVVGIISSVFTGGYGIFAVTVFSAIIHRSFSGVLIFIGIPLISRFVLHIGKWLMEIHPEQVKLKIQEFEEKQQKESDKLDEEINRLEAKKKLEESEIEELDKSLRQLEENDKMWELEDFDDDEFYDEEFDDENEDLSEQEIKLKIEQLELKKIEIERQMEDAHFKADKAKSELKSSIQQILEKQRNETENENLLEQNKEPEKGSGMTLADLMNENPTIRDVVYEMVEEKEIPKDTADYFGRDALIEWRKGNRELALKLYNRSIEIEPNNAVELLNRGNLQIEMGKFDEGIADLEEAASLDSTLPTHLAQMLKILSPDARENFRQHMIEKNTQESD